MGHPKNGMSLIVNDLRRSKAFILAENSIWYILMVYITRSAGDYVED